MSHQHFDRVILISIDLFIESKLAGMVRQNKLSWHCVAELDQLDPPLDAETRAVIVVDLTTTAPTELITALNDLRDGLFVIGFAPHVHESRLRAAVDAGFDEVVAKGQIDSRLRQRLANAVG